MFKKIRNIIQYCVALCIVLFFCSNSLKSELNISNEVFSKNTYGMMLDFSSIQPDTLNQFKLTSVSNSKFINLKIDGIPLFSLFDGQYNLTFLKNFEFENRKTFESSPKVDNINRDSNSSEFLLYSSNYNGLLKGDFFIKKKSIYFKLNSSFESSGGYYYSGRSKENVLDLKFLKNSAYQNIAIDISSGFVNQNSRIIFNLLYHKSKLYVPILLNDSYKYQQHFKFYDNLIGYLSYSNRFSDRITISGNFFFKNHIRDYGSTYDSSYQNIVKFKAESEIDEFSYGADFRIFYKLSDEINPLKFNANYSQNIFLFSNNENQLRERTESEQLLVSLSQSLNIGNKISLDLLGNLNSRAILYSDTEFIPENKSSIDFFTHIKYSFNDISNLSINYDRFSIFPFVAFYYQLKPFQLGNFELNSEQWNSINMTYTRHLTNKINTKFSISLNSATNLNYPIPIDSLTYRYLSEGEINALGILAEFNLNLQILNIKSISKGFFTDFSNPRMKLIQNFRLPNFEQTFIISKLFDFGLKLVLDAKYRSGIYGFNKSENSISKIPDFFVADLLVSQKVFTENIFLAIRNITNQYYEFNYFMPQPGINFLFGISLSF